MCFQKLAVPLIQSLIHAFLKFTLHLIFKTSVSSGLQVFKHIIKAFPGLGHSPTYTYIRYRKQTNLEQFSDLIGFSLLAVIINPA